MSRPIPIEAKVTDTNGRFRGAMIVAIEFFDGQPATVHHDGRVYHATGKFGIHHATASATREMADEHDARIWITLDGTRIWED
jgi:hypothetical protein